MSGSAEVVLSASGISKRYGHVQALKRADFDIKKGEVVGLIGDNGAGKSTLVKILSGATSPDEGTISLHGAPVQFGSSAQARNSGIETVYQDLALAPHLGVVANLYLGREVRRRGILGMLGFLDNTAMRKRTARTLADLGVSIVDYESPVGLMSGGQRQGIAVARAAAWASNVVFLDEPTAALGVRQAAQVESLIQRIRDERGVAVVLISHNMRQVMALADRVHVLRLGERVATFTRQDFDGERLVAAITGLYRNVGTSADAVQAEEPLVDTVRESNAMNGDSK